MTDWRKYDGTDEQIAEMRKSRHGFICRNSSGIESGILFFNFGAIHLGSSGERLANFNHAKNYLDMEKTIHYLICNPHPLADMISRQTQTGQPVYYRPKGNHNVTRAFSKMEDMRWNDPRHWEYSFTPFED